MILAINNRLDSQQHGARRKLARNQKKHAKKQQVAAVTASDVLDAIKSIQPPGDDIADKHPNNDLVNEKEEKKIKSLWLEEKLSIRKRSCQQRQCWKKTLVTTILKL